MRLAALLVLATRPFLNGLCGLGSVFAPAPASTSGAGALACRFARCR